MQNNCAFSFLAILIAYSGARNEYSELSIGTSTFFYLYFSTLITDADLFTSVVNIDLLSKCVIGVCVCVTVYVYS